MLFNIYGSGPHEKILNNNIKIFDLPNVILKGNIDNITEVWEQNELLCLPSRMEGQALALIEAMNSRRCAVVTNVGGAAELIEEGFNGFIAETASADSIDNALERAWQKRADWKLMGEHAFETIRQKYPEDAVDFFNSKILSLMQK